MAEVVQMTTKEAGPGLPKPLRAYIPLVAAGGMALLVYLNMGMEWDASTLAEVGLFVVLIIAAGSFLWAFLMFSFHRLLSSRGAPG